MKKVNDFKIRADIQLKVIERNCCDFIETDLGNTIEVAFGMPPSITIGMMVGLQYDPYMDSSS